MPASVSFSQSPCRGCTPCAGFFVATQDELDALESAALDTATAGVTSVATDGFSASAMDPMKQLDFVERLENRAVARSGNVFNLMRHARIISPGCGS